MAKLEFQRVTLSKFTSKPTVGKMIAEGTASFSTNVIDAEAIVQNWDVTYNGTKAHNVRTVGFSVDNVQASGTNVNFSISLQLYGDSEKYLGTAGATVLVIATCE